MRTFCRMSRSMATAESEWALPPMRDRTRPNTAAGLTAAASASAAACTSLGCRQAHEDSSMRTGGWCRVHVVADCGW